MLISVDVETTGLDISHGARPFLVTICQEDGQQYLWEWDVDPYTRKVLMPREDARGIADIIGAADEIVGHDIKFDQKMLQAAEIVDRWDWQKTRCTLVASHLLASGMPHDLTSLVLHYIGEDIKPLENDLGEAVQHCRRKVTGKGFAGNTREVSLDLFSEEDVGSGKWWIAKKGDPRIPSAESDAWHMDYWLPRAFASHEKYETGDCRVVNINDEACDVLIDRRTKWGNPFKVDPSGVYSTREKSVERYRSWIVQQPELMSSLGELLGRKLGCHCAPQTCHGHVLQDLVREKFRHPFHSVTSKYANADSAYTLALWVKLRALIQQKGLWPIYMESMRLPGIIGGMETRGVSYNIVEGRALRDEYARESESFARCCTDIAARVGCDLQLPKGSGRNASLHQFCFGYRECTCRDCGATFRAGGSVDVECRNKKCKSRSLSFVPRETLMLPPVRWTEGGEPSLDAESFAIWEESLEPGPQLDFVQNLAAKRKRDTSGAQLDTYHRFGTPTEYSGYVVLHPNLNQTGTAHLRMSSDRPNSQNAGKQERPCNFCRAKGEVNGVTCTICQGEGEVSFNVRRPFCPLPGREFWAHDFENIELRIPAFEAPEPLMVSLFEKPSDPPFYGSQHLLNASIAYPDLFWPLADYHPSDPRSFKKRYASEWYQWMKNTDFALNYECGEGQCDRTAHRQGVYRLLKSTFANLAKLSASYIEYARKHGYVETLPDRTVDPTRGYPIMVGRTGRYYDVSPTVPFCYHVSGTAMWCTRRAMVRCQDQLDRWNEDVLAAANLSDATYRTQNKYLRVNGYFIAIQVHDELLFDFPAGGIRNYARATRLRELMEMSGQDIGIPLRVSMSWHPKTWASSEPVLKKEAA